MTRVGITGHRDLPRPTEQAVVAALKREIDRYADGGLVGVSAIAVGADSLFARAVLDAGGSLIVIVPAEHYRDGLPAEHHPTYDALLARAVRVIALDAEEPTTAALMAAALRMLDEVDELIAVWDGEPARGYAGTADVVAAAIERGLRVTVIWPAGATR